MNSKYSYKSWLRVFKVVVLASVGTFLFVGCSSKAVQAALTWKTISVGASHTCGITNSDKAYCWGDGFDGQLGVGVDDFDDKLVPTQVDTSIVSTWKSISAGSSKTCGIASDDKAYCWGDNFGGGLGIAIGDTDFYEIPKAVNTDVVNTWKSISVGGGHICGITTDDKAYCWGYGNNGQLGVAAEDNANKDVPIAVDRSTVSSWKSIYAGGSHTCGMASDDKVYCWGSGQFGQLGTASGDISQKDIPTAVSTASISMWKSIMTGFNHTCGITIEDKAYCWGDGRFGRLGIAAGDLSYKDVPTPVNTDTVSTWKTLSPGNTHTCGIATDDMAYCWGEGAFNQLGTAVGDKTNKDIPTAVDTSTVSSWQAISSEGLASCGISTDGKGYCWGQGEFSGLGSGDTSNREVPSEIVTP